MGQMSEMIDCCLNIIYFFLLHVLTQESGITLSTKHINTERCGKRVDALTFMPPTYFHTPLTYICEQRKLCTSVCVY